MKEGQQHIEHRDDPSQSGLNVLSRPMMHMLEIADDRHQRQGRLHHHPLIPGAFGAEFAILWNSMRTAKTQIRQHTRLPCEALDEGMEVLIVDIHRRPVPVHHLSSVVEYPAELDTDTPPAFVFPFLAYLFLTAPSANGKEEFDRVAINHRKEGGRSQQAAAPVLMRLQEALQPSALRQPREQGSIIAAQPAIEGAEVPPLQRKQKANRDQFAGIEAGLRVLGHGAHFVIDSTENLDDNLFGGHEAAPFS